MNTIRDICRSSLLLLLKPLVRLCLQHSVRVRELIEFVKSAYVEVALEDLKSREHAVTPSRISVMTGLQRREVSRLIEKVDLIQAAPDAVSRVIGLWESGRKYRDSSGRPRVLSFSGRDGDFAQLVSSVSTDLNPYTVAFELERVGCVERVADGLRLMKPGYEPGDDVERVLKLLAEDNEVLYAAVSENVFGAQSVKNIHVKTEFDNIPSQFEAQVREWFLKYGGEFHCRAREFLGSLDRDLNPEIAERFPDGSRVRAAVVLVGLTTRSDDRLKDSDLEVA